VLNIEEDGNIFSDEVMKLDVVHNWSNNYINSNYIIDICIWHWISKWLEPTWTLLQSCK